MDVEQCGINVEFEENANSKSNMSIKRKMARAIALVSEYFLTQSKMPTQSQITKHFIAQADL